MYAHTAIQRRQKGKAAMTNITQESKKFLDSISAEVVQIIDGGMDSSVRVTLSNGMTGFGYYPAWKPLKLIVSSFN